MSKALSTTNAQQQKAVEICDVCEKVFVCRKKFRRHQYNHLAGKRFRCAVCSQAYRNPCDLGIHLRRHTGERPFQCELCDEAFTNRGRLLGHERSHSDDRPFRCGRCRKAYKYRNGLIGHLRMHSGLRPFECSVCKKNFAIRRHLVSHKQTHTGEVLYKCKLCPSAFSHNKALYRHEQTHADVLLFACSRCLRRFANSSGLIKHVRLHGDLRRFECSWCRKSFALGSALVGHLQSHAGIKRYACELCHRAFSSLRYLRGHSRRKHRCCLKRSQPFRGSVFQCNLCSLVCPDVNAFLTHCLQAHKEANQDQSTCLEPSDTRKDLVSPDERQPIVNLKPPALPPPQPFHRTEEHAYSNPIMPISALPLPKDVHHTEEPAHSNKGCELGSQLYERLLDSLHFGARAPGQLKCKFCEKWLASKGNLTRHVKQYHPTKSCNIPTASADSNFTPTHPALENAGIQPSFLTLQHGSSLHVATPPACSQQSLRAVAYSPFECHSYFGVRKTMAALSLPSNCKNRTPVIQSGLDNDATSTGNVIATVTQPTVNIPQNLTTNQQRSLGGIDEVIDSVAHQGIHSSDTMSFKCRLCRRRAFSKASLRDSHERNCSSRERPFQCKPCLLEFLSESAWLNHQRHKHPNGPVTVTPPSIQPASAIEHKLDCSKSVTIVKVKVNRASGETCPSVPPKQLAMPESAVQLQIKPPIESPSAEATPASTACIATTQLEEEVIVIIKSDPPDDTIAEPNVSGFCGVTTDSLVAPAMDPASNAVLIKELKTEPFGDIDTAGPRCELVSEVQARYLRSQCNFENPSEFRRLDVELQSSSSALRNDAVNHSAERKHKVSSKGGRPGVKTKEQDIFVGDLVFAKVKGYPPWPARVEDPFAVDHAECRSSNPRLNKLVFFFGTHKKHFCSSKDIIPFEKGRVKFGKPKKICGFNEGMWELENLPTVGRFDPVVYGLGKANGVLQS